MCGSRNPDLVADIGEVSRSIILKDNIVVIGECGIHQVHVSVVLIIAGGDAHVRHFAAVPVQGITTCVILIFKCAVAFVDVEVVWGGVIGDDQVGLAIVVYVHKQSAQTVIAGGIA